MPKKEKLDDANADDSQDKKDDATGDGAADDATDDKQDGDKQDGDKGEGGDKKADKTFTKADLAKEVAKAQKKWEKEKDLPEIDKLKKQNQELADKQREREISDDFNTYAEKQGAKNVSRLLKVYRSDLEISDDGKIENLSDVIKMAREDMPEFFPSKTPGKSDGDKGKKDADLSYAEKVDAEFEKTGRKNAFKI